MTNPYDPTMPFASPTHTRRNRRLALLLGALGGVVVVVAGLIVVTTVGSGDGPLNPVLRLFGANEPPEDPFTSPVVLTNRPLPEGAMFATNRGAADRGVRAVNGTEAGLYGAGSAGCDVAALGNRLAANPSAARAWAGVFGISTADIPYYLNTLTPVVLTADTWVTNHTYTSGTASAFQSVLQAGTAVLVDSAGVPRAVCSCGNPLAPPAATPIGGYRVSGTTWRGYQTRQVVRVAYNTENVTVVNNTTVMQPTPNPAPGVVSTVLSLINVDNGQLFSRTVGNVLNLTGLPPLSQPLPTPAALNTPFTATTDEQAAANGLARAGSTQAAEDVEIRASENGNAPEVGGTSVSAGAPAVAGGTTATSAAAGAAEPSSSTSSTSSAAPSPTTFTGSGEQIASLTFDAGGRSITCTTPADTDAGTVALTCSDSVVREVDTSALLRARVVAATDPTGVWTIRVTPATGGPLTVAVTDASWRAIPTTTTTTTSTVETPTTTETTTEAPTVEEVPTTTTEAPPTETTTTTEVPTTTTTTPAAEEVAPAG
ncbi:DUF6777 domain-containing protein [Gordonia insulae]|uniref:DUF6777 domain-containing protein n=1 Tax=Gordonia insulae TaxID=2420509 RepID=A0A3G8JSC5_9ACTN|nr:DUF6777 domain-containing protein [Gordonia insulae]AZG48034.1 hypothetical protein D7316_04647 [Gordonia insulae]